MKKITLYLSVAAFLFFSCKKNTNELVDNLPTTVKDVDGNVYNTVKIGDQIWMKENLKTTKFNDGTPITKYVFDMDWLSLNSPQALYQWAGTSNTSKVYPNPLPFDYYGAMYNHFAIESGKLAPTGWRIPTEQDFLTLKNYLTNNKFAGKEALALKSNFGWNSSSGNGTDDVGFRGLPNGYVHAFGGTVSNEGISTWATTSTNNALKQRKMVSLTSNDEIQILENSLYIGSGIRCIKE